MQAKRAVLSVLLILLACVACSPSHDAIERWAPNYKTENGELLYRLSVNNPSLSSDGRYMAFDFEEFTRDGKRTIRSRLNIGIYDIQKKSVEIFFSPIPEYDWHSPSFDRSGKRLTFVAVCNSKKCPDESRRTHIMILDIKTRASLQITNNQQQIESWGFNYATIEAYRTRGTGTPRTTVRGYPVFSFSGRRIYYVSRSGPRLSSVFWMQFNPNYWLNVLDLEEVSGPFQASDKLVQNKNQDVVIYKGDGRIAVLDNDKLVFSGRDAIGRRYKTLKTRQPTAFFYDLASDDLTVAIDRYNTPSDPHMPADKTRRVHSLTASYGGLIAAIRGRDHDVVTVWKEGRSRDILRAEKLGLKKIGYISLAGNGKSMVIMPSHIPSYTEPPSDIDNFWILDMSTGGLQPLPLRKLLREAIDANKPDARV